MPEAAPGRIASWSARAVAPFLALLSVILAPPPARAELRILETPHLRLIYNSPAQRFIASYTAQCFENSFRFHAGTFGWIPSEKVTVILDDSADFGNAAAWASPKNGMLIHLAPANFVYETGPANERIHWKSVV